MSEILKLVTNAINENDNMLTAIEKEKEKLINTLCDVQIELKDRYQKREKLQQELKNYYDKLQQWPVHHNEKCATSRPMTDSEVDAYERKMGSVRMGEVPINTGADVGANINPTYRTQPLH